MKPTPPEKSYHSTFERELNRKVIRKLKAQQEGDRSILSGLGLFGMVGWSVMVPTLLGLALGLWIDRRFPSPYSWSLMLLLLVVGLGCWNAWYWVKQEQERD